MEFFVVPSLTRVFPDQAPARSEAKGTALRNEAFSFQVVYNSDQGGVMRVACSGALAPWADIAQVGLVPSQLPSYPGPDAYYERTQPGLFPDPLLPIPAWGLGLSPSAGWRSIWVTLDGRDNPLPEGEHEVQLCFEHTWSHEHLGDCTFTLRVLPAMLPAQTLHYTCWTYLDCIAQAHHARLWSQRFWTLTEKYLALAARSGVNTILTPLLTPPLETDVGFYRPTVQLVDIHLENGKYTFDFARLERFVAMAQAQGISHFEVGHLFTQWGAEHAPQVVVIEGKRRRRLFGWDTDARDPAYRAFLTALLTAFREKARALGIENNCYYHVSDEPGYDQREAYAYGRNLLASVLGDVPVIDALQDVRLYTEGIVTHPVPTTDHIQPFLDANVKPRWGYYCCAQGHLVSNRFFSMPLSRTRILGVQLYLHRMDGFLQWGFNHYNAHASRAQINPFATTDADFAFPSGDAFSVYPGQDGPLPSTRLMVFYEGLNDMRALQMLESMTDRAHVEQLVKDLAGMDITFTEYPRDADFLPRLRARVYTEIQALLNA